MNQETSLLAYSEIKPSLGEKQLLVYNMLKDLGSANNMILSRKLGWGINRVTPRIAELRERGLVVQDSIRQCPITKRMTIFWKVPQETYPNNANFISIKGYKGRLENDTLTMTSYGKNNDNGGLL